MNRIELRHLRYVIALAEEGSFRRAAERLHVSQPPLSRQIRDVEDVIGAPLFERRSNGVTLTAAGAAFVPEARRSLALADHAVAQARAAVDASARSLSLGFTTVFDASAFPDLAGTFVQRHPAWRLTTRHKTSVQLVRDVESGAVDVALIALHTDVRSLTAQTLHAAHAVVALASGHALARKRHLRIVDLRREPLFWFQRRLNPGFHAHCRRLFEQWDYQPALLPEPVDHHVLLGRVAAGEGIALMAAAMRQVRRTGVVFRPLTAAPPLTMGVQLVHDATRLSAAKSAFLTLAAQLPADARA